MHKSILNNDLLRDHVGAGGEWARACGNRLKAQREGLGLDRQTVADLAGVSKSTLVQVERGVIVPRDYLRYSLAAAVGMSPEVLFAYLTQEQAKEVAA